MLRLGGARLAAQGGLVLQSVCTEGFNCDTAAGTLSWRPGAAQLYFSLADGAGAPTPTSCGGANAYTELTVPVISDVGETFDLVVHAQRVVSAPGGAAATGGRFAQPRASPLSDATPWHATPNAEQSLRAWVPAGPNSALPSGRWRSIAGTKLQAWLRGASAAAAHDELLDDIAISVDLQARQPEEYVHIDVADDTWRSDPLRNDPAVGSSGMWFAPEDAAVGSTARVWWGSSDYSVLRVQMYDESESTRHATLVIRAWPPPPHFPTSISAYFPTYISTLPGRHCTSFGWQVLGMSGAAGSVSLSKPGASPWIASTAWCLRWCRVTIPTSRWAAHMSHRQLHHSCSKGAAGTAPLQAHSSVSSCSGCASLTALRHPRPWPLLLLRRPRCPRCIRHRCPHSLRCPRALTCRRRRRRRRRPRRHCRPHHQPRQSCRHLLRRRRACHLQCPLEGRRHRHPPQSRHPYRHRLCRHRTRLRHLRRHRPRQHLRCHLRTARSRPCRRRHDPSLPRRLRPRSPTR